MSTTNSFPQDRLRVFARDGSPLAEFQTTFSRSWVIGDEGRGQFQYASRKSDIVNENVLQFGNWILVENDYLPSWVGVIDPPRKWGPRVVTVSCYSPERVLSWRRGPLELIVRGSAGDVFETLIQLTNSVERTPLRLGNIWYGGGTREETLNPTTLNEDLRRIFERSGEEYTWRGETDAKGYLVVYGDWYERLGVVTSVLLHEGKNGGNLESGDGILVEDEPIVNDLLGYGDGETWKSKPNLVFYDEESGGRYGMRQGAEEYSGVTSLQTIAANTQERLNELKQPPKRYQLTAINVGETFRYLRLGNVFSLRLENMGFTGGNLGFNGKVRIVAMSYDPKTKNKIKLITDEVTE